MTLFSSIAEHAQKILPFLVSSSSVPGSPYGIPNSKAVFILLISIQLAGFMAFLIAKNIAKLRHQDNIIGNSNKSRNNESTRTDDSSVSTPSLLQNSTSTKASIYSTKTIIKPTTVELTLQQQYEKLAEPIETVVFYYVIMILIVTQFMYLFSRYNIDVKLFPYSIIATMSLIIMYAIYSFFNWNKVKITLKFDDQIWSKRIVKILFYLSLYSVFSLLITFIVKKFQLVDFRFSK